MSLAMTDHVDEDSDEVDTTVVRGDEWVRVCMWAASQRREECKCSKVQRVPRARKFAIEDLPCCRTSQETV